MVDLFFPVMSYWTIFSRSLYDLKGAGESRKLNGKPKASFACMTRQVVANVRMILNPLRVYVQFDSRH